MFSKFIAKSFVSFGKNSSETTGSNYRLQILNLLKQNYALAYIKQVFFTTNLKIEIPFHQKNTLRVVVKAWLVMLHSYVSTYMLLWRKLVSFFGGGFELTLAPR